MAYGVLRNCASSFERVDTLALIRKTCRPTCSVSRINSGLCDGGTSSQSYGSGTVTWPCFWLAYVFEASERRAGGYGAALGVQLVRTLIVHAR